jgi:predicted nuclease with TOPRIM domain
MEVAEMATLVAAKTAINQELAAQHSVLTTEYEASQKRVEVLTQQAHQWNEEVERLKKAVEAAEARVGDASPPNHPNRIVLNVWLWGCFRRVA